MDADSEDGHESDAVPLALHAPQPPQVAARPTEASLRRGALVVMGAIAALLVAVVALAVTDAFILSGGYDPPSVPPSRLVPAPPTNLADGEGAVLVYRSGRVTWVPLPE